MSQCKSCGTQLGDDTNQAQHSTVDWANVARIASVAEAGYLANLLTGQGIAAQVVEVPSFSAIGGEWTHGYVLQVERGHVQSAMEFLQAEADEANGEAEWDEAQAAAAANSAPTLRVMGVLALAGVAGFWAGSHANEQPSTVRTTVGERLAAQIESVGRPFEARNPDDGAVHRIWYDRQRQAIVVERDADGGGNWKREHLYPTAELQ